MKTRGLTTFALVIVIASFGFAQLSPGPGIAQFTLGTVRWGPDGRLVEATVPINPPRMAPAPMLGAPYSAEEIGRQTQTLVEGSRITQEFTSTISYRDSAGRTRVERPAVILTPANIKASQIPSVAEIHDPVAGCVYYLDPAKRVAHQYLIPAAPGTSVGMIVTEVTRYPPPLGSGGQLIGEPLGTQMIDGFPAEGRRSSMTHPAGLMGNDRPITTVTESWTSQDLKITVLTKTIDPRSGESVRALVNIKRAEPDPTLFQPPPGYTVVRETGPFTIRFEGAQQ